MAKITAISEVERNIEESEYMKCEIISEIILDCATQSIVKVLSLFCFVVYKLFV